MLFIGGPLDGQRHEVFGTSQYGLGAEPLEGGVTYSMLKVFGTPVMAFDALTTECIFQRLLENYRPNPQGTDSVT